MTACSPEPVWTAAYAWACACGHVYDHSGRRTINVLHVEHLEHTGPEHDRAHMSGSHESTCHRCATPGPSTPHGRTDPMTTTAPNRTLTNAGRRELDRSNLAMALRLPAATPITELLDRVRDLVAEREALDLGRLQADLSAHVDQDTGLAYFLAKQLGEHVDDQGDETQIQTVQRLLDKVRGEAI